MVEVPPVFSPNLYSFCGRTCNSFTAMVTVIYLLNGHGRDSNVWPVFGWVFILSLIRILWGEGMDPCFPLQVWFVLRCYSSSSGSSGHKRSYVWNLCKYWGLKKGKYPSTIWHWTRRSVFSQRDSKLSGGQDGDFGIAAPRTSSQVIWQDWFVRNFREISFRSTHYVLSPILSISVLPTSHSGFLPLPHQNDSSVPKSFISVFGHCDPWPLRPGLDCSWGRIPLYEHNKIQHSCVVHGISTVCILLPAIWSILFCCERK